MEEARQSLLFVWGRTQAGWPLVRCLKEERIGWSHVWNTKIRVKNFKTSSALAPTGKLLHILSAMPAKTFHEILPWKMGTRHELIQSLSHYLGILERNAFQISYLCYGYLIFSKEKSNLKFIFLCFISKQSSENLLWCYAHWHTPVIPSFRVWWEEEQHQGKLWLYHVFEVILGHMRHCLKKIKIKKKKKHFCKKK